MSFYSFVLFLLQTVVDFVARITVSVGLLQLNNRNAVLVQILSNELGILHGELDTRLSFVQNGGDSILAIRINSILRSKGIIISPGALLSCKSVAHLFQAVKYSSNHTNRSRKSLQHISRDIERVPLIASEEHRESAPECPATSMQSALIHGSQTLPGRNIIRYHETYSKKHIAKVKSAWEAVVTSEPIFRTRFRLVDNSYHLTDTDQPTFLWHEHTARNEMEARQLLAKLSLGTDFLGASFEVVHVKTEQGAEESTVVWNIHHGLIDGFSSVIILNKHRRLLRGQSIQPGLSFVDLMEPVFRERSKWQHKGRDFWQDQQEKLETAASDLLVVQPDIVFNPDYQIQEVILGVNWEHLQQCAMRLDITTPCLFYAAWALTLSQYVDSFSVCFGAIYSGRTLPLAHVDKVVGPLMSSLPFHISICLKETTAQYLKRVFLHSLQLDQFQWAIPEFGFTRTYPTTLNIQSKRTVPEENPLGLLRAPHSNVISALPLCLSIQIEGSIYLQYHEHVYKASDARQLGIIFAEAVKVLLIANHDIKQCQLYLRSIHTARLSMNGNFFSPTTLTLSPYVEHNLVQLLDSVAFEDPTRIAIEKGCEAITYVELQDMSLRIARYLTQMVSPGEVVCVNADRSINWIAAIFGVLRAGAIYCPLDAEAPEHVRHQIFVQSKSSTFLATDATTASYRPASNHTRLSVSEVVQSSFRLANFDPRDLQAFSAAHSISPDDGAYLCFTSGTSGLPKGVLCSHRSLVAFQRDSDVRLMASPGWRIGQTMSPAFDGSIHEIFSALSYGSTLVLPRSTYPLEHLQTVDAAVLTPSIAQLLEPDHFPFLKALYLVGETVPQDTCDKWSQKVKLFNMYGPTEATCGATIKQLSHGQPVTLGRPNPTTRIYILDAQFSTVPPGVVGEIYLAGIQVSRGYWNNPEETRRRFLPDSICPSRGERMYRTGDRGFWNEDGELCFRGRNDRQIKKRGFRIDLDDVETRILQSIPDCTAVAVAYDPQLQILVAQIQPETLSVQKCKDCITQVLPRYAVPQRIRPVLRFPHTSTGKIDYRLIVSSDSTEIHFSYSPHLMGKHRILIEQIGAICAQVLGLDSAAPIDLETHFAAIGEDSLLQLQLRRELNSQLRLSVPLSSVVQSYTLQDLVKSILATEVAPARTLMLERRVSFVTPTEETWMKVYETSGGFPCHNVTALFELGRDIDQIRLCEVWNKVLMRHNVLRSRYLRQNGAPVRRLSQVAPRVKQIGRIDIGKESRHVFNLQKDHLFRIFLSKHQLFIVACHIICDYASLEILLQDVSNHYHGRSVGDPEQYCDRKVHSLPIVSLDRNYWHALLQDMPSVWHSLGDWGVRGSCTGSSRVVRISGQTFQKLRQFTSDRRLTAHQVSISAVALALQHHLSKIDLILGAPYAARETIDSQNTVGLFLESLPIRIQFDPNVNQGIDFFDAVRKASQEALCHATYWINSAKDLNTLSQMLDKPDLDIMVSYHDHLRLMGMAEIDAKPAYTWNEGSKFKLMVEFVVANEESLLMRLEYSDQTFDEESIVVFQRLMESTLALITNGERFEHIQQSLNAQRIQLRNLSSDSVAPNGHAFFGQLFRDM